MDNSSTGLTQLPADTVINGGVNVAAVNATPESLPDWLEWGSGTDDLGPSRAAALELHGVKFVLVSYDDDPEQTVTIQAQPSSILPALLTMLYVVLRIDRKDVIEDARSERSRESKAGVSMGVLMQPDGPYKGIARSSGRIAASKAAPQNPKPPRRRKTN